MGPISNTARNFATGAARHGGRTMTTAIRTPACLRTFASNATQNLNKGSQAPIVSECRNITEGIANGDFTKATVNVGMLGATAAVGAATGGAVKAGTTKVTASFIAGMSMGMIPFESGQNYKTENFGQQISENVNNQPTTDFKDAAQMVAAPEAQTFKIKPVSCRAYQGIEKQRARQASPSRRMMSTRNSNFEQEAAKTASKPFGMQPYFKVISEKNDMPASKPSLMPPYLRANQDGRKRSPSPSRRMMSTRNVKVEQEAAKTASVTQKKPALKPPYFKAINEEKDQNLSKVAGLSMSFHNYRPLI